MDLVLFDCASAEQRFILHGSPGGNLSLEIAERRDGALGISTWRDGWSEIRTGYVIGQQGGHQSHLRLSDGSDHFILFEGENGQLSDTPGETYAGVSLVEDAGGEPASLVSCEASPANRSVIANVRGLRARAGLPELAGEETGGSFDGWF